MNDEGTDSVICESPLPVYSIALNHVENSCSEMSSMRSLMACFQKAS